MKAAVGYEITIVMEVLMFGHCIEHCPVLILSVVYGAAAGREFTPRNKLHLTGNVNLKQIADFHCQKFKV